MFIIPNKIKYLLLHHIQLNYFLFNIFTSLNVFIITLYDNPWDCDFVQFLHKYPIKQINSQDIVCTSKTDNYQNSNIETNSPNSINNVLISKTNQTTTVDDTNFEANVTMLLSNITRQDHNSINKTIWLQMNFILIIVCHFVLIVIFLIV